jgi:hypothetical protein
MLVTRSRQTLQDAVVMFVLAHFVARMAGDVCGHRALKICAVKKLLQYIFFARTSTGPTLHQSNDVTKNGF